MKRLLTAVIITSLYITLLPCSATMADDEIEAAAVKAAEAWLGLIDDGQVEKSWEESASYFKLNVTLEQWVASMKGVREPLGELISRKVLSKKYMTEIPGAPDGEYIIIIFEASYTNKKAATETVTPMLDKDGVWRVSGYYIR